MREESNRRHLKIWIQKTITEEVREDRGLDALGLMGLPLVWSECVSDPTTPVHEAEGDVSFDYQNGEDIACRPKL